MSIENERLRMESLRADFSALRDAEKGGKRILDKLKDLEDREDYLDRWMEFSREASEVYPSQGLLMTKYDFLDVSDVDRLSKEEVLETLRIRRFFLEMFNHPYRMEHLFLTDKQDFVAPKKQDWKAIEAVRSLGMTLAIGDLGAMVVGAEKDRVSRSMRYAQGPFVKLGRQARSPFVGSESPDVWNSAAAIATMAASHCLAAVPRNGLLNDVVRQAAVAVESFDWLERMAEEMLVDREDGVEVFEHWRRNIIGAVSADPENAIRRAEILYKAGVRGFRIYSPEPGKGPIETTDALRQHFGDEVEIMTGQVVSVAQAKEIEDAGAEVIYLGIGGGGRCITGVRSGSVVDWPELLWDLRGEIDIPVVIQGGATDHVAVTFLLGASGIGVSRAVSGGTIESPGGMMYCIDSKGRWYKPYGGEASARTKFLDGKLLPFGIPSFVEGETTMAQQSFLKFASPTLTYNLHELNEDAILAMVFRGVESIGELHALTPTPLRWESAMGNFQRNTH